MRKAVEGNRNELSQWVRDTTMRLFHGNMSEWARAAGVSPNTVSNLQTSGRGDATSLIKLADAANANRATVLVIAGILRDKDVQGERLSPDEEALIAGLRSVPPSRRPRVIALAQAIAETLGEES